MSRNLAFGQLRAQGRVIVAVRTMVSGWIILVRAVPANVVFSPATNAYLVQRLAFRVFVSKLATSAADERSRACYLEFNAAETTEQPSSGAVGP